jgi:hypothetical protein
VERTRVQLSCLEALRVLEFFCLSLQQRHWQENFQGQLPVQG